MSCKQRSAQRNARRGRLKGIAGLRAQPGGRWLTYNWWAWPRFDYAEVEARVLASVPLQQPSRIYPRNVRAYRYGAGAFCEAARITLGAAESGHAKTVFEEFSPFPKNFPANTVKN